MLGVWFFSVMRRAGQLELVIVVSYVTLFGVIGGLMLKESVREFVRQRRGIARPVRRAGDHPAYLGLPLRMRFPQLEALRQRHPDRRAVALRRLCRRGARHRRRLHGGAGADLPLPRAADGGGRDVAVPDPVDDARRDRPAYGGQRRRRRRARPDADRRRRLRRPVRGARRPQPQGRAVPLPARDPRPRRRPALRDRARAATGRAVLACRVLEIKP